MCRVLRPQSGAPNSPDGIFQNTRPGRASVKIIAGIIVAPGLGVASCGAATQEQGSPAADASAETIAVSETRLPNLDDFLSCADCWTGRGQNSGYRGPGTQHGCRGPLAMRDRRNISNIVRIWKIDGPAYTSPGMKMRCRGRVVAHGRAAFASTDRSSAVPPPLSTPVFRSTRTAANGKWTQARRYAPQPEFAKIAVRRSFFRNRAEKF